MPTRSAPTRRPDAPLRPRRRRRRRRRTKTNRSGASRPRRAVRAIQGRACRAEPACRTTRELRLGTRGSQLALWQANTVAARIADAGGPPCQHRRSSRPPAIGCRTRRSPRSAASGCSSRRSKTRCSTARSTSRCTAARTCRRSCPTGWRSPACCRAKIRATRWCCRRRERDVPRSSHDRRARRGARPDAVDRHRQRPPHRAADAAVPGRAIRADPRQPRHPAAQARRRRATMRWCWPRPDCAGSGSRRGSR